jgi:replicative DNA helicase
MDLKDINRDRKNRKRQTADLSTMVYGKLPPQAKDLEEAVLGAIMIEKSAFDSVNDILKPEMFYVDGHQKIFLAMQRLAKKNRPIDILMVVEELRISEELEMVGGPYYVTTLTNAIVSSANIESHSKIILQKFIQRELIRIAGELIQISYEDSADPFELLDEAEESLSQVGQALDISDMTPIDSVLIKAIQQIEDWRHLDSSITGVPSGYKELDKATRGWQNGDLIIVAARPSVGKTAFALNLIRNAAMLFKDTGSKKSTAVWSLEMKSLMLVLRMLAAESREILYRIQTGRMDEEAMGNVYRKGVQKLSDLKIFFDDHPGLTIQKLRSKARKLKRKNQLGLIVVDYLQLMTPEERSGTREQEISKISRSLKNLAQELDIPIIALSQLSREIEKRTGAHRRPQLSDLRESGSLEQDADVVLFLWGPTEEDIAADASLLNRRYLSIAKQRNGVLIKFELDFKDEIQLFSELDALPGSWKQVDIRDFTEPAKLYIQTGSKMNDLKDDADPF